jgi:hypothetical protein
MFSIRNCICICLIRSGYEYDFSTIHSKFILLIAYVYPTCAGVQPTNFELLSFVFKLNRRIIIQPSILFHVPTHAYWVYPCYPCCAWTHVISCHVFICCVMSYWVACHTIIGPYLSMSFPTTVHAKLELC